MGAQFNFTDLAAKTEVDALEEGQKLIDDALYDHGHAGYTGSFAECTGVLMVRDWVEGDPEEAPEVFPTDEVASAWLLENAEKWGPMIICKVADGSYVAGAWCSS